MVLRVQLAGDAGSLMSSAGQACTDALQGPVPATTNHDGLRRFHVRTSSSLQIRADVADAREEARLEQCRSKSPASLARVA